MGPRRVPRGLAMVPILVLALPGTSGAADTTARADVVLIVDNSLSMQQPGKPQPGTWRVRAEGDGEPAYAVVQRARFAPRPQPQQPMAGPPLEIDGGPFEVRLSTTAEATESRGAGHELQLVAAGVEGLPNGVPLLVSWSVELPPFWQRYGKELAVVAAARSLFSNGSLGRSVSS